jgi:hypothetical protein
MSVHIHTFNDGRLLLCTLTISLFQTTCEHRCLVSSVHLSTGKISSIMLVLSALTAPRFTSRHVFGQPAKKEYGVDNVKVSASAWDTNLIAASGVRVHHRSLMFSVLLIFDVEIPFRKLECVWRRRIRNPSSPFSIRCKSVVSLPTPGHRTSRSLTHGACPRH